MKLFARRPVILPTAWGWFLILFILFLCLFFASKNIYSFLAKSHPIKTQTMVVEGWLPDYALEHTTRLFNTEKYTRIITTGTPLNHGSYLKEYRSYADLAKASLVQMGIPAQSITALPSPKTRKDRTYISALMVAQWLQEHPEITSVNLCNTGSTCTP